MNQLKDGDVDEITAKFNTRLRKITNVSTPFDELRVESLVAFKNIITKYSTRFCGGKITGYVTIYNSSTLAELLIMHKKQMKVCVIKDN